MTTILLLIVVVFLVNLLPAFGPPTWSVLVLFKINTDINPIALVLVGAAAAASGRFALASLAAWFRPKFSKERIRHLNALKDVMVRKKGVGIAGLGLFALSPMPSNQLFIAAGIVGVSLLPLTLAFFSGRLVTYSIYVTGATIVEHNFREVFISALKSPWAIVFQVVMLFLLIYLGRLPWAKILHASEGPAN